MNSLTSPTSIEVWYWHDFVLSLLTTANRSGGGVRMNNLCNFQNIKKYKIVIWKYWKPQFKPDFLLLQGFLFCQKLINSWNHNWHHLHKKEALHSFFSSFLRFILLIMTKGSQLFALIKSSLSKVDISIIFFPI